MRGALRLATGILGLLATAAASADEKAVLEVVLNGRVVGDRVVVLAADGDVLVPAELLRAEGLEVSVPEGRDAVSLRSLAPRLAFAIDEPNARLELTVDPSLLPGSRMDLERRAPSLERVGTPSLLANYALRVLDAPGPGGAELEVPWELAGRLGPVAGLSDFHYSDPDGLVRLTSRLVWDDIDALRRVTLGDFVAATPVLGSQLVLGGISFARDFGLQPYVVTSPEPSIEGVLQTPSDLEIYLNDTLVERLHLPAGEFDLRNLPARAGAGEVRVLIRDAFGRVRELGLEFYATSRLLKSGIHQYAYQLGRRREHLGETSFDYGDPAFLAFHRLGVSDVFTAGLQAELDPEVANAGCELDAGLPGRLGEIGLVLAGSHAGGRSAGALSLGWSWRRGPISTGFAAQAYGAGYATVERSSRFPRPRLAASSGVSASLGRWGSVSLFLAHERPRERDDRTRAVVSYVRPLTPRLFVQLGSGFAYDTEFSTEVSAALTLLVGRRGVASARARRTGDVLGAGLAAQWRPPLGTGFGMDVDVSSADLVRSVEPDGRARLEYRSDFGVVSGEYKRFATNDGYLGQWAGSLVAAQGRLRVGRPVSDGFALIRVSDLPDVLVSYNNEPVGRTDAEGVLLVPELRSQVQNRLSIQPHQVPFGYRIGETDRSVTVPFRGGGLVDFGVTRLRAYEGRLVVVDEAGAVPAEYGRLELERDGETLGFPVGSAGALYLEGVEPGTYTARILHRGRACEFRLELPDRRDPIADVGEIACTR